MGDFGPILTLNHLSLVDDGEETRVLMTDIVNNIIQIAIPIRNRLFL